MSDRSGLVVLLTLDEFGRCKEREYNAIASAHTLHDEDFDYPVVYPSIEIKNGLGSTLNKRELRQLRLAETEKCACATFFSDGGNLMNWALTLLAMLSVLQPSGMTAKSLLTSA